jgi:hypothetical protein
MSEANAASKKPPVSDIDSAFFFAHQLNIKRYRKILQTYLTDEERAFVQRRLFEEEEALLKLTRAA